MRTIAIINQKGGCGKTTVSINLAATLASKGQRTLLVDMDPQSHCALGLAVPDAQIDRSMADLLIAGMNGSIGLSEITWQVSRHFDLAPSTMALAGIEQRLVNAGDKDRRLAQVLSTVQDRYDFCVVDCPPAIGLLTFNALRASDEVLIPVETGYFALQGSIKQEKTIEMLVRRVGHHVRFHVLPTMYDVRTKLAREILSELKKHFGDRLSPIVINFNSKLKEAASFGQPITEYDAASRGMQDFEQLSHWLITNPPVRGETEQSVESEQLRNPALSRAAELVERARSLSARAAVISAKLAGDDDMQVEKLDVAIPPAQEEPLLEEQPSTEPVPDQRIREKLSRVYGVRNTSQGLLFVQPANGNERQLAIAGDFNSWIPARTPMVRDEHLGVWQACIHVPPGRYRYRLVVDGRWMHDPYNKFVETNPFGELNNVVEINI